MFSWVGGHGVQPKSCLSPGDLKYLGGVTWFWKRHQARDEDNQDDNVPLYPASRMHSWGVQGECSLLGMF